MSSRYAISNESELRSVIEAPNPSVETKVFDHIDPYASRFIAASPLLFMATVDAEGNLDVSPKGDAPGFVHVEDERTLLIPDRKGNRLTYGFRNILATGQLGLIFVVPSVRETLRVNGRAELSRDPALLERLPAKGRLPLLVTRMLVREAFSAKVDGGPQMARDLEEMLEEDYRSNLY
jgi:PPOX class probable FMN-dependent enzyme